MAPTLLSLPLEVLHAILLQADPQDIARFCCCRTLNNYIKGNRLLFRELYLRHFDAPSLDSNNDFAWESELPKLVKLEKILLSDDVETKKDHLQTVLSSTKHLLDTAANNGSKPSRNIQRLSRLFELSSNVQGLMCSSLLFDLAKAEMLSKRQRRVRSPNDCECSTTDDNAESAIAEESFPALSFHCPKETARMRQLSAKLHVLYGVPIAFARHPSGYGPRYDLRSDLKARSTHPFARSLVYDLRRYTDGTLWGPFMDDHSQDADWERLEAIMIVLAFNIQNSAAIYDPGESLIPRWNQPFAGASPHSFVSPPSIMPREPELPLAAQDPYNVTGTWMRVVCFLDYNDFFSFNFIINATSSGRPRHPLEKDEAFHLILMKLEVTKIEPPGEDEGKGLPVIHFKGMSSAVRPSWDPNANSKIRGLVRLTPQGEVRWTSWSIFNGEERWRSEGIQIGGPQSARGVLGNWFDKDYDAHGPAGPTCFWKVTDEIKDIKPNNDDIET